MYGSDILAEKLGHGPTCQFTGLRNSPLNCRIFLGGLRGHSEVGKWRQLPEGETERGERDGREGFPRSTRKRRRLQFVNPQRGRGVNLPSRLMTFGPRIGLEK